MAERAADAPRVDALLDRLGDRLSTDAPAKRGPVPRPIAGRRPTLIGAAKAEPPASAATDPSPAVEPVAPVAPSDAAPAHQLDAMPSAAEGVGPSDPPDDQGVLQRFPAAAQLDGPPPPRVKLELHSLEDVVSTGSSQTDSLPPPSPEGSGVAEPSLPRADAAEADAFAEFERGELPQDSTRIEDRDLLADESTNMLAGEDKHPTLYVESGKDTGREFTLQEGETGVGRGIDNDIILTDVSVSRKHMRLVFDQEGITLVDLGSGNGTLVNGRRVHRALLGDGDRIEIGETVLVTRLPGAKADLYQQPTMAAPVESTSDERLPSSEVVAPAPWTPPYQSFQSAAPPPEPTPSRGTSILLGRSTLLVGAALLVVIASMVGAIAMALLLHEEPVRGVLGGTTVVPLPPAPAAPVVATPPTVAAPTSAPLVPTAATSAPPVTSVPVTGIPPTTVPPTSVPPSTAVASTATPVGEQPAVVAPSSPPIGAPEVAPATAAVAPPPAAEPETETLPETAPSRREATAARDDTPRASTSRASSTRASASRETAPSARALHPSSSSAPDPRILAAYRRQAFPEAAQLARAQADAVTGRQRTTLEQLARNIDTFARRFPEARRGNFAAIEEAYRMDRRITGGEGAFASELVPRLVGGYVSRARSSMGSQPADACGDVRSALALQSSHPEARTLFRECETRARRMLGEAQRLERSDAGRARTIYGDVVSMLGGSHEIARDATARLVAMNRTTSSAAGPRTGTGTRPRHVDEDE